MKTNTFYKKYIKYKVKKIRVIENIQKGGELSDCVISHFNINPDNSTLFEITIPTGTFLYSGSRERFPTNIENVFEISRNDTKIYKFFTLNIDVAIGYSKGSTFSLTESSYVGVYKTTKDIYVYVQSAKTGPIFFMNDEYHSTEAQCLCSDTHAGYSSYDHKYGIDDIGICDSQNYLEFVGYYKLSENFAKLYNINATIINVPIDNSNVIEYLTRELDGKFI